MSEQFCDLCGIICEAPDLAEFSGQRLCPSCLERETRICDHCFERIWAENDYGDSSRPLCQDCYDRYYATCSCCGRVVPFDEIYYPDDDDDRPLCY
ncbi:MAG: zinc-binding protein, partial [Oscillospiraceae bacterium]|nr:zinc-binding protein [Oscillospiraceae bacterium]